MQFKRLRRTTEPVTDETISIRAYEIWQARGCPEGDGSENWEAAKAELTAEAEQSVRRRPIRRLLARLRNRRAA